MVQGKNINLYLIDGEVSGIIKCTLYNWTGVIYKIPRTQLTRTTIKNRMDLKHSGIYFLIGSDMITNKNIVYVGQASNRKNGEGILSRVLEHTRDNHSDYFNEVLILTTQTNTFGPTEISYLEHKFTQLAKRSHRYTVRNSNEPSIGNVTEEKESELDEVIENSKVVIGALGYRIFKPVLEEQVEKNTQDVDNELTLYLERKTKKSGIKIKAVCKRTSEGFVVLKDSMIDVVDSDSLPTVLVTLRENLRNQNVIKSGILRENQLFSSPSYASAFILGMSSNGRTDWKNEEGKTLKEIEEN